MPRFEFEDSGENLRFSELDREVAMVISEEQNDFLIPLSASIGDLNQHISDTYPEIITHVPDPKPMTGLPSDNLLLPSYYIISDKKVVYVKPNIRGKEKELIIYGRRLTLTAGFFRAVLLMGKKIAKNAINE